ncbi:MAG: hypothetical protein AAF432_17100, partial [Planctomycetota bacterium]
QHEHLADVGKYESPYTTKKIGERPANGWPLVIAMHGGGGVPAEINDAQWRHMQVYYRDHPEVGGYVYLALRAPTDEWNGFYTDYVYPLIEQLIRNFTVHGDIDPNRVYLIGYSHGGYGAFAIGPKLPHRFAAIHASAAAPTDGQTTAKTLRTVRFSFMIGEKDESYGRIERCRAFNERVVELRKDRTDIYDVEMKEIAGHGHTGLPDRDMIVDLAGYTRDPMPQEVTWAQTDSVVRRFYWIEDPNAQAGREINASCRDNIINIDGNATGTISLHLDQRLIDVTREVVIRTADGERRVTPEPTIDALIRSIHATGDPHMATTMRIDVVLK